MAAVTRSLVVTAILATAVAGSPGPAQQAKSAAWTVNYNETQCTAQRKFAQNGRDIEIALSPALDGSTYEFILSEGNAGAQLPQQISAKVELGVGAIKAMALNYRDPVTNRQTYRMRLPASAVTAAGSSDMSFRAGSFRADLQAMNLAAALGALETCARDLRAYWNLAAKPPLQPAAPKGNIKSLLTPNNHSDSGMWGGVKGSARYILFIDAAGNLVDCDLASENSPPVLGLLGCDILRQRIQFTPARDESGAPVRSVLVTEDVRWRIG